jgi:hypothetical protein
VGSEETHIAIMDKVNPGERPDIISPYKAIDLNDFDAYLDQLSTRAEGKPK